MSVEVDELFAGDDCETRVWVSQALVRKWNDYMEKKENPRGFLLKKLQHYAKNGFWNFEGEAIRRESEGVYRVGHPRSLFRIIGFYEDETRTHFIAIDAFQKRGQSLIRITINSFVFGNRKDRSLTVAARSECARINRDPYE